MLFNKQAAVNEQFSREYALAAEELKLSNEILKGLHRNPNASPDQTERFDRRINALLDSIEALQEVEKMGILTDDESIKMLFESRILAMQNIASEIERYNNLKSDEGQNQMAKAHVKDGWVKSPDGKQIHYKNGVRHNAPGGAAEMWSNGTLVYRQNGKLHREGGLPAMIGHRANTPTEKYAVNGKYHRTGGMPAIIWGKGSYSKEWWENGKILSAQRRDGTMEYYLKGCNDRDQAILHRDDGPAVVRPSGIKEWWLEGKLYGSHTAWLEAVNHYHNVRQINEDLDEEYIDEDPVEDVDSEDYETSPITEEMPMKEKMTAATPKPSITQMLKANATAAGYRVAGTQMTNAVKSSLITVMRSKGVDGGQVQAFASFLDTEFGQAIISTMLGLGMNYIPHFGEDPRVQKLAEEMRVNGMATAGNAVIGEAMNVFLPAITQILSNLPAAEETETVRVEDTKSLERAARDEEEEEETTEKKVMNA